MVAPSGAPLGASDLRALNLPLPIAVDADETGAPQAVQVSDRWVRVIEVLDAWRIDEEWWRQSIVRLYYLLLLEDGRSMTVFHDRTGRGWYRQGYG